MIKSLIMGMIVLGQTILVSRLGSGMQSEQLWMLLLVATLPLLREPLTKALEEREKEKKKNSIIN